MELDVAAYESALSRARVNLDIVFDESKFRRDPKGRFAGKPKTITGFHGVSGGGIVGDFHHPELYIGPPHVADAYAAESGVVLPVEFQAKNALVLDTAEKAIAAWDASGVDSDGGPEHFYGGGNGQGDRFAQWARKQGFDAIEITPAAFYEDDHGNVPPEIARDWTDETQEKWNQVAGRWGEPQTIILDPARAVIAGVAPAKVLSPPRVKATGTGGSPAELAALKKRIAEGEIAVRVPPEALDGIFSAGGFKSYHTGETSTRGMATQDQRAKLEQRIWDIPPDAPAEKYPIYGYLSPPTGDPVGTDNDEALGGYGAAKLTLKPSVKQRSTVTVGDSLMEPNSVPSPMTDPQQVSAAGVNQADIRTGGIYVEAQIFGGIKLSDIAAIHFGASEPTPSQTAAMKAAGISWTVDPAWRTHAERIDEWGFSLPLDRLAYEAALDKARLNLAVFDENLHPRLHGKFAKKHLAEGLTLPTKGKVTSRAPTNIAYTANDNMAAFKAVEHKAINEKVRKAGESGTPLPKEGHGGYFGKAGPYGSVEHDLARTDFELGLQTTKKDMTVLRAVTPDTIKDKKVGDSWVDHGFVSTSMTVEGNKNTTDHFSTFKGKPVAYLKIHVPKGTHAHDFGHKDQDRELTLDRGLEYHVTGEERDHDGNRVLLVSVGEPK